MTDSGRRQVLITRPEPDASETARAVAARGWEPVVAPVIAVRTGRVSLPATAIEAVVVTSRNAIAALPEACRATRLLAVGRATAARAAAAGFTDVVHADGDAADLLQLAQRSLPGGGRLLVAHGRGRGRDLIVGLRAMGFRVHGRVAYRVSPVRRLPAAGMAAIAGGGLLAVTFLSAETARAFVRCIDREAGAQLALVDALAIGEAAAAAVAPLPWRRVRVSLRPTLDHVLALL